AVDQAEADLLSAEEALDRARNPYNELDRQKAELDVAQAEAALEEARLAGVDKALRQAEFNLKSAQLNLAITQRGSTVGKTVRDLEYSVGWHERKLRDLQAAYQQGKVEQSAVDEQAKALAEAQTKLGAARASARSALTAAESKVAEAEEALAKLQGGSNALSVLQIRNKIAQAEYNLAKARDSLAGVVAGPDAKSVQLAQARYDAAKAALEKAQATLAAATLVAPFDGTVLAVGAAVGDLVSSNTSIVTLADLSSLEVLASVDETDVSQVKVGQEAQITFDAFPGSTFRGKVLEVPLEGSLSQNVVTYQVRLSLEGADGVDLRSGMTANVKIVTGQRQDALLVPLLAVQQSEDGYVVLVQDTSRGAAVTTRVQVGLNDGTYVEIVRGLNEGDQVVVEYQSTTQQQSFVVGMGGFGSLISGAGRGR
ncbi:MAG: efflux RND transporter periplasmic adaptor subunit, partial [Chloroflexi bacterium]|nr:efflux RND transporter periplasmic adaptor subunit [Chloroflexota bacterium]